MLVLVYVTATEGNGEFIVHGKRTSQSHGDNLEKTINKNQNTLDCSISTSSEINGRDASVG
jgi:hypothetical protein